MSKLIVGYAYQFSYKGCHIWIEIISQLLFTKNKLKFKHTLCIAVNWCNICRYLLKKMQMKAVYNVEIAYSLCCLRNTLFLLCAIFIIDI